MLLLYAKSTVCFIILHIDFQKDALLNQHFIIDSKIISCSCNSVVSLLLWNFGSLIL